MVPKLDFNHKRMVANIRWYTLKLERLEHGPVQKTFMCAAEFAEVLDEVLFTTNDCRVLLHG